MNKQDLKSGMTCTLRNGEKNLVLELEGEIYVLLQDGACTGVINSLNSNLEHRNNSDYDIMEVFDSYDKDSIIRTIGISSTILSNCKEWCGDWYKSIWKREEEKHESNYSYPEGFKIDSVSWNGDGEYTGIVIAGKQYDLNITK